MLLRSIEIHFVCFSMYWRCLPAFPRVPWLVRVAWQKKKQSRWKAALITMCKCQQSSSFKKHLLKWESAPGHTSSCAICHATFEVRGIHALWSDTAIVLHKRDCSMPHQPREERKPPPPTWITVGLLIKKLLFTFDRKLSSEYYPSRRVFGAHVCTI